MARIEGTTDLWINLLLRQQNIQLDYQSSRLVDIDKALKTASKKLNGKHGYPEFVGIVKDYVIVIEDKADLNNHVHKVNGVIDITNPQIVMDYALNGALHYAEHILKHTEYTKCFAIGVSGNEKHHRITPLFINERLEYRQLEDIDTFVNISEDNIDEYYTRDVLKQDTRDEKNTATILKDAATLHEDLRNYGNLKDTDKPLVVSGILLALREGTFGNFKITDLTGDNIKTDGQKIVSAITDNLKRSNVSPEVKRDKLLNQFSIIEDSAKLNEIDNRLGKTPLRYFTEFLNKSIFQSIRYTQSSEDYLGRFYGEFMSYSGGDGQSLGIILTPKHITELFCELADLKPDDVVFDPTCGTAGFLIAAMHDMLSKTTDDEQKKHIRKNQLHGIELQDYMFTIATTNMILRGDGKSNLVNDDFLKQNPAQLQLKGATVGMMNPPYSQGSKSNPDLYEISFIEHLLDSLTIGAKGIVIVPQSTMVGKSKDEKNIKANILKHHTLEGVITCNTQTFYGVGTNPVIAVFTAGEPHPKDKEAKFIDFRDDGYEVSPHIGLIATDSAKDKQQHLLDVWFDRIDAQSKFCVKSSVLSSDEWLHSFFYFNDEIPTDEDFEKSIGDYLTFQFSMIMQNRGYLFGDDDEKA
ncbi:N-6 DNA methylase [Lactiplantibacillus plantarum]|nr:N-6 DNA methylase [Lactiplantibacillus plantarum]MBO2708454.1 N-6 DNA methylase [Lactiplantibacillus plantarum]